MKIGGFDLERDVLVVAEIGNNHEGSYALAEEMIGLAAEAGAGAVKFQTFVPERLASSKDKERIDQLRRFQFSFAQFEGLVRTAAMQKVLFLSTPFDLESLDFLVSIAPAVKIASGDNTFFPLIERAARTGKPILLSGGLCSLDELETTKNFIENIWEDAESHPGLAILHCVVSYPTPPEAANLMAIRQIATLGVVPGYSDHTLGVEAAAASVCFGARIVEKHFTISKTRSQFRDHQLSADPGELAELVRRIREMQVLMGTGEKKSGPLEEQNRTAVRRSLVASRDLESGRRIEWPDLNWVRPGGGLAPGEEFKVMGKRLRRPLRSGEPFVPADLAD